jgi:hypothetical protein
VIQLAGSKLYQHLCFVLGVCLVDFVALVHRERVLPFFEVAQRKNANGALREVRNGRCKCSCLSKRAMKFGFYTYINREYDTMVHK